jgi:transposase
MIHPKMKWSYVGVDSHKETHHAVFLDCFFTKLGEITFNNIPGEFEAFLKEAGKYKAPGTKFAFGLEDVSAYGRQLTVFLKSKKQMVRHVNSALVANERKSRNILHKTDSIDAECTARVLLSRFDEMPVAGPQDKYWLLASLVARRNYMMKTNVALKSQLHTLLADAYPSYRKFFTCIACKTSLAFFEAYPSPSKLSGAAPEELALFMKKTAPSRYGIDKAKDILMRIEKDGGTTSVYQDARDIIVTSTVRQLRDVINEIAELDKTLASFLTNFDYNLTSMRGIDTVTAARLIAEIGDINRFSSPAKLARYAGIAPVTYASGKSDVQFANGRGNRRLNEIFFRLSVFCIASSGPNQKVLNACFRGYYHKKISEGKTKRQALKCIQRRLVNIIYRMMKHKTEYQNPPLYSLLDEVEEAQPEQNS